jgi:hypothetical protein
MLAKLFNESFESQTRALQYLQMALVKPTILDVIHQVGIARVSRFMGNTIEENNAIAAVTDIADVLIYSRSNLDMLRLLMSSLYGDYPPPL